MREFQDDNTFRKAVQPPRQNFFEFLPPPVEGNFYVFSWLLVNDFKVQKYG